MTQVSVKNFMLEYEDSGDDVALLFGRVDKDRFSMDVAYPMSLYQGFAICASMLDKKTAEMSTSNMFGP